MSFDRNQKIDPSAIDQVIYEIENSIRTLKLAKRRFAENKEKSGNDLLFLASTFLADADTLLNELFLDLEEC